MARHTVVGINFDHMHMGDNLRMAHEHPDVEIVGICDEDPTRMQDAARRFAIAPDRIFTDYRRCLERTRPDIVLLCPATAEHATWLERVAPYGPHMIMEKPFAATLAEADRMIAAMANTGRLLAINWPLAWYPPHLTSKRLIDEGAIGEVLEVHYYDGNRGPLWHTADKTELAPTPERKAASWFYSPETGRRLAAGLPGVRRYPRHLVPRWQGSAGGHRDGRHARRAGGGRAQHHRRPLRAGPLALRDPLGHLHRSLDPSAAA